MRRIERIRDHAIVSVGRACLFTALGMSVMIFGLISWPVLAMKAAAVASALVMAVLAYKGMEARRRSYRKSETWLLLGKRHDLPEPMAERVIPDILQEIFWRYARYAAGTSVFFWGMAFCLWALGPRA
jgi:hypothetical protein